MYETNKSCCGVEAVASGLCYRCEQLVYLSTDLNAHINEIASKLGVSIPERALCIADRPMNVPAPNSNLTATVSDADSWLRDILDKAREINNAL